MENFFFDDITQIGFQKREMKKMEDKSQSRCYVIVNI